MAQDLHRQSERFRVNFAVRFSTARDFVEQYAENLSAGGLFVNGAHQLRADERVTVELDLPGFTTFIVTARVVHVLTPEVAAQTGRQPGAGLSIVEAPQGFTEAIRDYLFRLGKRRDHLVLTEDGALRAMLESTGYRVGLLPAPPALGTELRGCQLPIVGLVMTSPVYQHYAAVAAQLKIEGLLCVVNHPEEFEALLRHLDSRLP